MQKVSIYSSSASKGYTYDSNKSENSFLEFFFAENFPKMKKGVLTPSTNMHTDHLDENTIKRLDTIYAKEYSVAADVEIILKSINKLGN